MKLIKSDSECLTSFKFSVLNLARLTVVCKCYKMWCIRCMSITAKRD